MDLVILIPLLVVVLIVLLVLKKRQNNGANASSRAQARGKKSVKSRKSKSKWRKKTSKNSVDAADDSDTDNKPAAAQDTEEDWDWQSSASDKTTVSVAEVDHLTEYKVYKQFGYFQKAADSLAAYLRGNKQTPATLSVLITELANLCLEAGDLDQLSDVIDHYRTCFTAEDLEKLIRQGLTHDANHLGLRVLAEDLLHWSVRDTDAQVGVNYEESPEPQVKEKADNSNKQNQKAPVERKPLIKGSAGYFKVHGDEREVLLSFTKPEKSYALLKEQLPYDAAIRCLNKAIDTSKKPAGLIIDALVLDYRHNNINVFAQHLWHLYYTLGQYGHLVKERMLGWGYNMGQHPMFDALESKPNETVLKDIGVNQGYLPVNSSALKAKRLPLVEDTQDNSEKATTPAESILRDAESLLTFGQLDQALELLEESILKYPQESQLYISLFDLYERAEEWPRLQKMLQTIRTEIKAPPEEVALAMSQLLKRINHDGVQNQ